MNYPETLKYLFEQLPMYQRTGKAAYKGDLNNTHELDRHFGHPHRNFRTIHVGGTNGKGSVSHMLASVLQSAGYKTGLYTSPHLIDFRERVRINGKKIPEQEVVDFVAQNRSLLEKISPSFFEMTVALAFDYFSREKVDVAVIEVGLGGRLDSTNIITPDLSIITNIGMDHTRFLGNTLTSIAKEKAGIIKPSVPLVIGRYQPEIVDVFKDKTDGVNAPLLFAGDVYEYIDNKSEVDHQLVTLAQDKIIETFKLPLLGSYQHENLITVLTSVGQLRHLGYSVSEESIHQGLDKVVEQTGLMGRWQKLADCPLTICDAAHNADGVRRVVAQLVDMGRQKLHIIWGMVNDKDISGILALLPREAQYYFTKASIPRALDEQDLQKEAEKVGLNGDVFHDVRSAIDAAKKNANDNDLIFIGGSTFVVAEALAN